LIEYLCAMICVLYTTIDRFLCTPEMQGEAGDNISCPPNLQLSRSIYKLPLALKTALGVMEETVAVTIFPVLLVIRRVRGATKGDPLVGMVYPHEL